MLANTARAFPFHRSPLTQYAVAVLAVLGAVALRLALAPILISHAPLLLFTLSVMVAARFGGVAPGLVATGLSALIGSYFFIEPYYSFHMGNVADGTYLALFVVVGVGISLLNGQLLAALKLSAETGERYQTLSEAVPQLVWTARSDGGYDYLNARWVDYTGIAAAQQMGFAWLEQVHPADRRAVREKWQAAVNDGSDLEIEFRVRRHDGAYRWFDTRAVPLRDAGGRIVKWFGSSSDIDAAREAREALRRERERLDKIIATAPGAICSFRLRPDGTACFPYASPRITEIYGLDPQVLAADASPVFDLMPPEDARRVRESIAESARTMAPWRDQFRIRHAGRGEIWVEGHSQPEREPDGSVEWYGSIADITQRHSMEQALRDRRARLEELTLTLDLAQAMVWKPDGTITYWSQGAAAMYGWTAEEAVGRVSHELLKTVFPAPLETIQAALFSAGRWEGELRHHRRDGTPVAVASHWALHYDSGGQARSIVEVDSDISEQKRVERELRASEERLELAQEAAGIGAWDWDIAAREIHRFGAWKSLYGLTRTDLYPPLEEWVSLIHAEDRERVREELQGALDGLRPYDTEFRVVNPDGAVRWLMGKGKVYRDGGGRAVRMLGVNMDVTDRKTAAEQLRALSASLISAQEEERRRISREIHDDLTQRLGLMAIDLGRLAADGAASLHARQEDLRILQERAVEAAELSRHIAHELHPSILDDLGIEMALRSYCEEFARREEIEVEFTSSHLPPAVKRETASCLYAVAREGLQNVSKHARATRVAVVLAGGEGAVRLTISDNGIGFAPEAGSAFGLGCVNMRERVRWVRGTFSLESRPGAGTRLAVEAPVAEEEWRAREF